MESLARKRPEFRAQLIPPTGILTICATLYTIAARHATETPPLGKRYVYVVFLLATLTFMSNCGGGGASTTPPPPPPPAGDFVLALESPTIALQQGGAPMFQSVQASPANGFTGTIQLSLSGLPPGVTGMPLGPYSLTISGSPQSLAVQLFAAPSAGIGTSTITVSGTSGAITHTATFSVNVTQAAPWTIHASPPSVSLSHPINLAAI